MDTIMLALMLGLLLLVSGCCCCSTTTGSTDYTTSSSWEDWETMHANPIQTR